MPLYVISTESSSLLYDFNYLSSILWFSRYYKSLLSWPALFFLFYQGSSVPMVEFLEAKIQWQAKMINDLEKERDFLTFEVQGGIKKTSSEYIYALADTFIQSDLHLPIFNYIRATFQ